MTREVSPEEYRQMVSNGQASKPQPDYRKYAPMAAIIVACLLVGFALGMQYEKGALKNSGPTAASAQSGANSLNGFGGRGARRGGSIGQVTAVSSDSITVQNDRTGGSETFKITGSTTVSNNGASANISDVKTGDTVMIRTSTTDTSTATTILLNPSFGGPSTNPDGSTNPTDTPAASDSTANPSTI